MEILVPEVESYLEGFVKLHMKSLCGLGEIGKKAFWKLENLVTTIYKTIKYKHCFLKLLVSEIHNHLDFFPHRTYM